MRDDNVRLSKTMSHALRHAPGRYGLVLDEGGWVPVPDLLIALAARRPQWAGLSEADLREINDRAEKRRFEFCGGRIRALYGHSVAQPVVPFPATPPPWLFHGTAHTSLPSIMQGGLRPMRRQFVHLVEDVDSAKRVGRRHGGRTVVLAVDAPAAQESGILFYPRGDGIWLSDPIPPRYLRPIEAAPEALHGKCRNG